MRRHLNTLFLLALLATLPLTMAADSEGSEGTGGDKSAAVIDTAPLMVSDAGSYGDTYTPEELAPNAPIWAP